MFSVIFNYIVLPALLSTGAFGMFCVFNPTKGKGIITAVLWHGVNMYSKVTIMLENAGRMLIKNGKYDRDEDTEKNAKNDDGYAEDHPRHVLSYYNNKENACVSFGNDYMKIPTGWWKKQQKYDVMGVIIVKKTHLSNIYYKTFENYEQLFQHNDVWSYLDKQFLQVELIYTKDNKRVIMDIHKYLDMFYVKGNKILSKSFLQLYLKKWYSMDLEEDYSLKIFDKDINLFNLKSTEYILFEEDTYKIIQTDTEIMDSKTSAADVTNTENAADAANTENATDAANTENAADAANTENTADAVNTENATNTENAANATAVNT